jgi:hypothetical protein
MPSDVWHRRDEIAKRNGRFVHYTSAENALKIIQTREVWMRNVRCMDDYREVQHGYDILQRILLKPEHKIKFNAAIDQYADDTGREAIATFIQFGKDSHTYISCISEHDDSEDKNGRLSMWRAFGGRSPSAAIVLKLPLNTGSAKGLRLWLSPVFYLRCKEVEKYFLECIQNLHGLISNVLLTAADRKVVLSIIASMLVMSAVSLKPGADS